MQKFLLLTGLLLMSLLSCKRNPVVDPVVDSSEIRIGSQVRLSTKADPAVGLHNEFVNGDTIGVYSVLNKEVSDFSSAKQSNLLYTYDKLNSIWSSTTPLLWQFTGTSLDLAEVAVDLVAYYPHSDVLTLKDDKVSMDFAISSDQTDQSVLSAYDLLWARSTGLFDATNYETLIPGYSEIKGVGLKKSTDVGKTIELKFYHIMAALKFNIALEEVKNGADEKFEDVRIVSIEVVGEDVTTEGVLNLSKGTYVNTANAPGVSDNYIWKPQVAVPITINGPDSFKEVASMVIQPTDFTNKSGNVIMFTISYKHIAATGVAPVDVTKTFYYTLGKTGAGDINKVASNSFHNVNVIITISSNEVRITSTIAPWTYVEHAIKPD